MSALPIEPFDAAIKELAAGAGPIRERLIAAWFQIVSVPETQLPNDLRQEYMGLLSAVSHLSPRGEEGKLVATISKMSDVEALTAALGLLQLWFKLRSESDPTR